MAIYAVVHSVTSVLISCLDQFYKINQLFHNRCAGCFQIRSRQKKDKVDDLVNLNILSFSFSDWEEIHIQCKIYEELLLFRMKYNV